jgi:ATP-dependent Clp protease adaptor protein ClpS
MLYFCSYHIYFHMRNGSVEYQEDVLVSEEVAIERNLVLFNDEVNTFDFVIESLIDVCGHEPVQAEQCTILVHYHGKCTVKSGDFDALLPLCTALHDRGLSAEVK